MEKPEFVEKADAIEKHMAKKERKSGAKDSNAKYGNADKKGRGGKKDKFGKEGKNAKLDVRKVMDVDYSGRPIRVKK